MDDAPLHRLHEFVRPSSEELDALRSAAGERLTLDRKQAIRRQGEKVNDVYFLASGWVASCVDTATGRRQIVKVHLPGDLLGVPSMCLERAGESLVALTRVTVDVIPLRSFARLFEEAPRLGFAIFLSTQQERVMLMDRITSIGRTTAPQRIAALLVHIHDRLKLVDERNGRSFELPLTQEELAQATGLTAVHINRTFQELDRMEIIQRRDRRITLTDLRALRELAALPSRKFVREPAWLSSN
jgi:CRP-like cAMP-binding protein